MAKLAFLQEPAAPTAKNQLRARWLMLLSLCCGLFGSYYIYDLPAATENNLATYFNEGVSNSTAVGDDDGGSTSEDSFAFRFNLLYSVYSFPNCVLPFFGGLVSDRLGVRLTGVVFMALILLGQIITAVGTTLKDADTAWYVMWLGRTVFGLGGESLSVAQSAFVGEAPWRPRMFGGSDGWLEQWQWHCEVGGGEVGRRVRMSVFAMCMCGKGGEGGGAVVCEHRK